MPFIHRHSHNTRKCPNTIVKHSWNGISRSFSVAMRIARDWKKWKKSKLLLLFFSGVLCTAYDKVTRCLYHTFSFYYELFHFCNGKHNKIIIPCDLQMRSTISKLQHLAGFPRIFCWCCAAVHKPKPNLNRQTTYNSQVSIDWILSSFRCH